MNDFFNTIYNFSLASRAALMDAVILICIEFSIDMENADLEIALRDYFSIAILEFFCTSHVKIHHLLTSNVTF
jgi:hypothetical protein